MYNVDITNSVESFNGVIWEARNIIAIIAKKAEWFNKYRKEAAEIPYTKILCLLWKRKCLKDVLNQSFLRLPS